MCFQKCMIQEKEGINCMARARDIFEKLARSSTNERVYSGVKSEMDVYLMCVSLGYYVVVSDNCCDFKINRHNVEVKSAKKIYSGSYTFEVCQDQVRVSDFVIFHARDDNDFYIVPIEELKKINKSLTIYKKYRNCRFSINKKTINKILKYKNNWDLLKINETIKYALDYQI